MLREELGGDAGDGEGSLFDRFEWIHPVPLSTASLAQVHRVTLKPTTTMPPPPGDEHTGDEQQQYVYFLPIRESVASGIESLRIRWARSILEDFRHHHRDDVLPYPQTIATSDR